MFLCLTRAFIAESIILGGSQMITAASSNSDQTYASIEPSNTAEAEITTATAAPAPTAQLQEGLSSTLQPAEDSPTTTQALPKNVTQMLALIMQMITMISELIKLRETPAVDLPVTPPPDNNTVTPPPCPGPTPPAPPEVPAPPVRKPIEQGSPLGRSTGFLWKPESDKDKKLAILLPPGLSGQVAEVVILSPDGKRTLQRGRYSGVGNGGREHYRFSKAGDKFPDGSIVVIKLKDGTSKHMVIKETSARLEKK